jgi:hypothetical protein
MPGTSKVTGIFLSCEGVELLNFYCTGVQLPF